MLNKIIQYGDIWFVDLNTHRNKTNVQQGIRPCIVISNELNNQNSPVVTVIPLTSRQKPSLPTHVIVPKNTGLNQESLALCECVRTIDIKDFKNKIGSCDIGIMIEITKAIEIQINKQWLDKNEVDNFSISYLNELKNKLLIKHNEILFLKNKKIKCDDELIELGMLKQDLISYLKKYGKINILNKILKKYNLNKKQKVINIG